MRKRVPFLLLLAFALPARPAAADPLVVTNGVFVIDLGVDIFTINGDGFSLATETPDPLNLIQSTKLFSRGGPPSGFPHFSLEAESQVIDWGFDTTHGDQLLGTGNVMLDGINATDVDFVGSMRFDAVPTPLLSGGSGDFEYVAPFAFAASIRGIKDGQELFARDFLGSGQVIVNYEASLTPGVFGFHDDSIRYEFGPTAEPVPEPATLLLLGSGLGAAALRRRRRASGD